VNLTGLPNTNGKQGQGREERCRCHSVSTGRIKRENKKDRREGGIWRKEKRVLAERQKKGT